MLKKKKITSLLDLVRGHMTQLDDLDMDYVNCQ